jgi:hypothetical protein
MSFTLISQILKHTVKKLHAFKSPSHTTDLVKCAGLFIYEYSHEKCIKMHTI